MSPAKTRKKSDTVTQSLRPEFAALANSTSDVLIIGGGINGISIMRDLSLQGVSVTLVDRGDVMSGASAASSHMIHGGIRYLENGEFRLVKESVIERNDLLRTAPHVVKPLRTLVPIFSLTAGLLQAPFKMLNHGKGKRTERGALLIGVGLIIYETFSRANAVMSRFRFVGRRKARQQFPSLRRDVKYVASYYDASVHEPERLALDLVLDAQATGNASVVTYAAATATQDGGVEITDMLTGASQLVRARVVINASGPFTDITNGALGRSTDFMGGTKGSHIVVDHPQLFAELAGRELFFENADGRIVLIYPVKNRVLIGTTDIFVDPHELTVCTDQEIDYFFDLVKHVLPGISLDRSQIVFHFSGIRPLPKQGDALPGFVSRDYRIDQGLLPNDDDVPLISVIGGKWTTFRALGEHVAGIVLERLGRARQVTTRGHAIGGGKDFPVDEAARETWIAARRGGLTHERAESLFKRYGTRADLLFAELNVRGDDLLESLPDFSAQELAYIIRTEQAVHLDDVLMRRTCLAFSGELSEARVSEIASVMAGQLDWSAARRDDEIDRAWAILGERHGVAKSAQVLTK
jgi:glycerol-3-phosphate dehydrogenase